MARKSEAPPARSRRTSAAATKEAQPARRTRAAKEVEEKPTRRTRTAKAPVEEAKPARRTTRASKEVVEEKKPTRRSRKTAEEVVETKPTRRTRGAKAETGEEVVVSGRKKTKAEALASTEYFDPYAHLDNQLDEIERHIGLSASSMDGSDSRQSTGTLAMDLVLGGGITAGWYTNFGQEQSCKTTDAVTMLAAALNSDVPILSYFDFEGSATPDYIENIMRNMGVKADVKSIFGVRDEKTGNWVVKPRVRYNSEAIAEKFFDYLAQLQRMLPDKKKIGENWYYIYESKKMVKGKSMVHKANQAIVGDKYDKNYFKKTGLWRIPAKDGTLQAMVLVDSYPAMLPETQDVDDPNSSIGVQARMFAEQLRRVKGKMKGKRIAVLGINQLRLRPMVMMGNPEYEPCGEALKLYSDVRLKHTSRALSAVSKHLGETVKGEGQIESERSATYGKGMDNYRYLHVRAFKNKLSRPYLEMYLRLWITDAKGNAQGFDPVFDVFQYLKFTGQVSGPRRKMKLMFEGNEATKFMSWMDFKKLILGKTAEIKEICASVGMKPVKIRDKCFAQLANGRGIDLFVEYTLQGGKDSDKGNDDEEESGDDEDEE
jgi:RecA/RadA recombinase